MTLGDLSQILNVSTATISRTLNHPELVAEHTRDRVLAAVREYRYQPNAVARSLRKGETRTIGLIVSDIQNPFYSTVARAIERVATTQGYSVVIFNADEDAVQEAKALHLLGEMQVSGIIHGPTGANLPILNRLKQAGIPIVDIDRVSGLQDVDAVLVDNIQGGILAAEHLLGSGHKQFAIVTGPLHLTTGRDRLAGFRKGLQAAGQHLPKAYVGVGDFRESSGYTLTQQLLALDPPPTALFAANNEMMAGALAAIRERRLRIPEDLSLISFDDVRWARYTDPPLTIVAQPTEEIGITAAEFLFERLQGRTTPRRRTLTPRLVARASCGPPPLRKEL